LLATGAITSRDPRKLRVFLLADALVIDVYHATNAFPPEERFGRQMELRRAAVSAANNIVEGSARRTTREYLNFLNISIGSSAEVWYLLSVSFRLGFLQEPSHETLTARYTELLKGLQKLMRSLEHES
jgi:four helix bundle protein